VADLVGAIVLLLGMQARPVAKAALGFVKAALSSLPPASLEPHLPGIVQGIMGWLSTTDSQAPAKTHALTRHADAVPRQLLTTRVCRVVSCRVRTHRRSGSGPR
jgi:hypothetical protein